MKALYFPVVSGDTNAPSEPYSAYLPARPSSTRSSLKCQCLLPSSSSVTASTFSIQLHSLSIASSFKHLTNIAVQCTAVGHHSLQKRPQLRRLHAVTRQQLTPRDTEHLVTDGHYSDSEPFRVASAKILPKGKDSCRYMTLKVSDTARERQLQVHETESIRYSKGKTAVGT